MYRFRTSVQLEHSLPQIALESNAELVSGLTASGLIPWGLHPLDPKPLNPNPPEPQNPKP